MSLFSNMRVGARLRLCFGSLVLLLVLTGGVGLYQARQMNAVAVDLGRNAVPSNLIMGNVAIGVMRFRALEASGILAVGTPSEPEIARLRSETLADIDAQRKAYVPYIDPGLENDTIIPAIDTAWKDYLARDAQLRAMGGDKEAAGRAFNVGMGEAFERVQAALKADFAYSNGTAVASADAADAAFRRTIWTIGGITVLGVVLAVTALLWLDRTVTARVVGLAGFMRRLTQRDYGFDLPGTRHGDEIGDITRALDECRTGLKEGDALATAQGVERQARERRGQALESLVKAFEDRVGSLVSVLSSGATELQATAQSMASSATRTNHQATRVGGAADQASTSVGTVAAAVEELTSSIGEIGRQVAHSTSITRQAVVDAQRTDGIVRSLAEGAEKIGNVVGLISSIAGQTNLLALNATIESARAGEAGKGFAVVASEVKSLATQTAKATEEIGLQIAQVQSATKDAVEAIRTITATIEEVSSIATRIAAAVDEQGAATAEIVRNVQETARAAQDVRENIGGVSQASTDTGAAAGQVLGAANDLSRQSENLTAEVNSFVVGVRAA